MRKNILSGLSILIPFIITLLFLRFFLNKLTKPFVHHIKVWLINMEIIHTPKELAESSILIHIFAQLIIVLALVIFVTLVGFLIKLWALESTADRMHTLIKKLPFISKIYDPLEKTLKIVFDPNHKIIQSVHLNPFPSNKSQAVCFKLNQQSIEPITSKIKEKVDVILIPTVPNPLMGFLLFFKSKDSKKTKASTEEGVKYNVSCGLIHPENITKIV